MQQQFINSACKDIYSKAQERMLNLESHIQTCSSSKERLKSGMSALEKVIAESNYGSLTSVVTPKSFGRENRTTPPSKNVVQLLQDLANSLSNIQAELEITNSLNYTGFIPATPNTLRATSPFTYTGPSALANYKASKQSSPDKEMTRQRKHPIMGHVIYSLELHKALKIIELCRKLPNDIQKQYGEEHLKKAVANNLHRFKNIYYSPKRGIWSLKENCEVAKPEEPTTHSKNRIPCVPKIQAVLARNPNGLSVNEVADLLQAEYPERNILKIRKLVSVTLYKYTNAFIRVAPNCFQLNQS